MLLYELLTGTTPLDRKRLKNAAIQELLRVIREEEPPKPSTRLTDSKNTLPGLAAQRRTEPRRLTKQVCGELDWIVMKCLEKDRTRRYETADGLGRDVERYLSDEAVEAYPPGAGYRLRKMLRRYKRPLAAMAAVFLVLMAGVVVSTWQAIRAGRAEQEARRQRDSAEAVRDFLRNDLLRQVDAEVQFDHLRKLSGAGFEVRDNPTINELLDRAAAGLTEERIEQKFPQQSLAQAEILYTVGEAYSSIGEYDKATIHLQRSADLRRIHLGLDNPDTLNTLSDLAAAYHKAGKTLEAVSLFEEVRDIRLSRLGPDHSHTLTSLTNLGWVYCSIGKTSEGITLIEQARDGQVAKFGPNDLNTLKTLEVLAFAYKEGGRPTEGIVLLEKIRDKHCIKLGVDHPHTLRTTVNLTAAYLQVGRYAEAIDLSKQMLPTARRVLGEWHLITTAFAGCLIECLEKTNQFVRAADVWAELVSARRKQFPTDDFFLPYLIAENGYQLLKANKPTDAESLLRECLAIREKKQADIWETFNTKSMLGAALLGQKKFAEAEPLLLKGYEGLNAREKTIPENYKVRLPETLDWLIDLYTATNKPEEAKKWLAERAKYPPPVAPSPREKK